MSNALEDKIERLIEENQRLRTQNAEASAAFAQMRRFFADKPATLECLASLENEVKRAQVVTQKDHDSIMALLGRFNGSPREVKDVQYATA